MKKSYSISAYDTNGTLILTEHASSSVKASSVAREFLTYANVGTVDVERNNIITYRYARLSNHSGIKIDTNGKIANIRF